MRRRPMIHTVPCPRCGKQVATLTKSLYGLDAAKKQYEGLCSSCVTEEEEKDIIEIQARGILAKYGKQI